MSNIKDLVPLSYAIDGAFIVILLALIAVLLLLALLRAQAAQTRYWRGLAHAQKDSANTLSQQRDHARVRLTKVHKACRDINLLITTKRIELKGNELAYNTVCELETEVESILISANVPPTENLEKHPLFQ